MGNREDPANVSLAPALLFAALLLGLAALGLNEFFLGALDTRTRGPEPSTAIRWNQGVAAAVSVALVAAALAARRVHIAARTAGLLFFAIAFALPLVLLELGLRPIAELGRKPTSIFVRDPALGWKLRPGAEDDWAGIRVQVNEKGLRGPEVPYARRPGTTRILYLGDSVTFGFGLARAEHAFPYVAEQRLKTRLGRDLETVNAGIGGYSPWQHLIYLRGPGLRYAPDLVVVGFVLNDVTEKLGLRRFGGPGIGLQLALSRHSRLDSLQDRSALVQVATRFGARLRFGDRLHEGATRAQQLQVESLVHQDEDAAVAAAWKLTFESLDAIVALCRSRGIPVVIVSFPFAFQLERPELNAPQRKLAEFARRNGIPFVDLLPLFASDPAGRKLFLDDSHLSVSGSELAGRYLADALHDRGVLP